MSETNSVTSSELWKRLQQAKQAKIKAKRKAKKTQAPGHVSVDTLYAYFLGQQLGRDLFIKTFRSQSTLQAALLGTSIASSGSRAKTGISAPKSQVYGAGSKGQTQIFTQHYWDKAPAENFIVGEMTKVFNSQQAKEANAKKNRLSLTSPEPINVLATTLFGRIQIELNKIAKTLAAEEGKKTKSVKVAYEKGSEYQTEKLTYGIMTSLTRPKGQGKTSHWVTDNEMIAMNNLGVTIRHYQGAQKKKGKVLTKVEDRKAQFAKDWKTFQAEMKKNPYWAPGIKALTRGNKRLLEGLEGEYAPSFFAHLAKEVKKEWAI